MWISESYPQPQCLNIIASIIPWYELRFLSLLYYNTLLLYYYSEREEIERKTRGQASNTLWMEYRRGKVTASMIGQIYTLRPTTNPSRLVSEINQTAPRSDLSHVPAIAHGQRFEADAREYYEAKYGQLIEERGFMLHPTHSWLGASTDGFISDPPSVVEIKCPLPIPGVVKLSEMILQRKNWFLQSNENGIQLGRKHKYYYQCQIQMACLEVDKCIFIVYLYDSQGNFLDLHTESIIRDDFVVSQLIHKAEQFHAEYC